MISIWIKFKCGHKVSYRMGGVLSYKCGCKNPSIEKYQESKEKPDWY